MSNPPKAPSPPRQPVTTNGNQPRPPSPPPIRVINEAGTKPIKVK